MNNYLYLLAAFVAVLGFIITQSAAFGAFSGVVAGLLINANNPTEINETPNNGTKKAIPPNRGGANSDN